MSGRFILTAAEMRAAEARAIASGTPEQLLMDRAGTAAAEAIRRYAGGLDALVLCGPGNNGGDGYVVARRLAEAGIAVRVAALAEPKTAASRSAAQGWSGRVEPLSEARPAALLIDALFGTGLSRPLPVDVVSNIQTLAHDSSVRIAIDLPSGAATDDGALLSAVPDFDLTVTFAALKPSHLLQPAARRMGRLVIADIGIEVESMMSELSRPRLPAPDADAHKYRRGYVAVVGGDMLGASALAATAALRAGAGYVRLVGGGANGPMALVRSDTLPDDDRMGAVVIGPGLGNSERSKGRLLDVIERGWPLILDADAIGLASRIPDDAILTPHEGEFERRFGRKSGSKVDRARAAAAETGAVVLLKGADTVIAAPDGRAAIHAASSHWLASAGTGDVLAGVCGAMRARGLPPFEAACAATWLHGRAAELAGPALIADDLLDCLPAALVECA